ncbi:TROVE domain-containing protein [Filimonas lacunae]|uniref:TROVE domain-containing protein n=1 Tax=Filimonas lacunae TaxID=477680 RepID=A0A173MPE2_9BACT|nr:TROVE domain-containing protein [Filimonas lacunae]BAV09543.1 ribonucleoprotein-related protein [Filimonas lacunae]SIS74961.1 TROVE domain-containing protein [Filimonas lacunae]
MKFNHNTKAANTTINHQGAKAFLFTPEMELYTAVATTLLTDACYEKADARLKRMQDLMQKVEPQFVAKLAVYARNKMYLRTAPVVMATELAKLHQGDRLVSKTIAGIVQRPDEIMELLACYQAFNKRTATKKLNRLSKQVQKGLAVAFNRFDEYQFAKYNRSTTVKLKDALFLVHPKPKDDAQQALFNKIVADTLATPYTWETELSALGQQSYESEAVKKAAIKAKWEELIDSRKLGYMALLRNLRNIMQAEVSGEHMQKVTDYLSNENAVKQSKQLPFRFLSAYTEVKQLQSFYTGAVMNALEAAVQISIQNMEGLGNDTRVVIACDTSGSMMQAVSPKSVVQLYDIGLMLGMLLQLKCRQVQTGMFGDTWKIIPLPTNNVLANVETLRRRNGEVGYSTNGYLVLKDLIDRKQVADKVMLFTDMQLWDSNTGNASTVNTLSHQWKQYKQIAPDAKLYVFDLAGRGQAPISPKENDVYVIAGWSDKVFSVLDAIENGADTLSEIRSIEL